MIIIKEQYKGYDIVYHTSAQNFIIKQGKDLATRMSFASIKAAKTIIDTFINSDEGKMEPLRPPITEEKLNEIIPRPPTKYSNTNFNS